MTSTLAGMLAVFDVAEVAPGRYRGISDAGERDVIDGTQLLAQAIVAASKHLRGKTVRRADAVFCRPVRAAEDIDFDVTVLQDGRTFGTAVVTASQREKPCATVTLLLDTPTADLIRHPEKQPATDPEKAIPFDMPLEGRELRLVGVADPNDPDEVGPPELTAWLRYAVTPDRLELRQALLAHFTGHLSISTTMRAHPGIGTAMAHRTISTAVMAVGISFHEPLDWDGWIAYDHESTSVGAGMSYVRGQIRTAAGHLLASFSQDGMIRGFEGPAGTIAERARL